MTFAPNVLDFALAAVMALLMAGEVKLFGNLHKAASRLPAYAYFITYQWLLVACIAALWVAQSRPWAELRLQTPGGLGFAAGTGIALVLVVLAIVQYRAIITRPDLLRRVRKQITDFESLAPHTDRERRIWTLAAITAGCCEEVFFRGFLLTFVAAFTGMLAAVVICSVLFGVYHAYYGWRGMLRTGAFGFALTLLVLLSGSLWPAIVLHAAIDSVNGDMAFVVISQSKSAEGTYVRNFSTEAE